jgi:perosamine synthetase
LGWEDISNTLGSNFRMTEIEAAIAAVQLTKLDVLLAHRAMLAEHLTRCLNNMEGIHPPVVRPRNTHSWYTYAIRYQADVVGIPREVFVNALQAEGIPVGQGYIKPLYLQPMYQQRTAYGRLGAPWTCSHYKGKVSYETGICPVAERLHDHILLHGDFCHYPLTTADMNDIANAFQKVLHSASLLRDIELMHHA